MSCWLWALVIFVAVAILFSVIGLVSLARRFNRLERHLADLECNTPPFTDWRRTLERNKPRTH